MADHAEDISLDDLDPSEVTTPGREGPAFVWARIAAEDLARVDPLDVRSALPRQRPHLTKALLRTLVAEVLKVVPRDTSDDAMVHQDSGLLDRDLYLRLANAGVFPSGKVGRTVFARWGDVRAALQSSTAALHTTEDESQSRKKSADDLRMRWGLAPTGKK